MGRHLRDGATDLFDYTEHAAGLPALREKIAAYVSRTRAVRATAGQVVIVNGSQQALDLCARLVLDAGDTVGFENPGYQGAGRIFEAHGALLKPAGIDADGIMVEELPATSRLVYVTPSHQFPTGVSMTLARRLELIQWAKKTGAVILEDDYSSEYRYQGPPLPALQGLAEDVPVLYVGTFSKIMFPGLRIGYIISPPALVTAFSRAKWLADRNTPLLEQMALVDFMQEGHLERHIRRMRRLYGKRRDALVQALAARFGEDVEIRGDAAGMHVMARFSRPLAPSRRVMLQGAEPYYVTKPPGREYLFGFSSISERAIREGVRALYLRS
jgi:GntR family transcriptional regulator/MocR family aminotransferase